ncbi:hypothetical protein PILCRDRAFT_814237 [Piloderma croceum F 1598]|uniref:Uncharacterized protein n=1 Tax=Piloderma croceum (strain F 1598) TaxID=765440 RepID=A0A0C3FV89_PILCF|nr:hypothetical protein PILCRDRAFT_814237 [Piloderma croceum F 1598]
MITPEASSTARTTRNGQVLHTHAYHYDIWIDSQAVSLTTAPICFWHFHARRDRRSRNDRLLSYRSVHCIQWPSNFKDEDQSIH